MMRVDEGTLRVLGVRIGATYSIIAPFVLVVYRKVRKMWRTLNKVDAILLNMFRCACQTKSKIQIVQTYQYI